MILAAISVFTLAACSTGTTPTNNNDQGQVNSETNADVVMDMQSFSYTPNTITATAGETLTIQLNNLGGTHDFIIDELDVDSGIIADGSSQVITITIPEDAAGETYEYYCGVSNHRQLGMVGTLVIQ